jgi:ribosomal protein L44E
MKEHTQLDNEIKRAYLEKNMLTSFGTGKHRFVTYCDFCRKKFEGSIKISKNNKAYAIKVSRANFHHLDGNPENDTVENMRLYCRKCHKNVHYWGIIQRWLEKTGKSVKDLPDSKNLKPMTFGKY